MAGIYIHIPFCKKACHYCDFHFSTNLSRKKTMLEAIQKELEDREDYLKGEVVNTIYFGGGTPSLLDNDEIIDILNHIKEGYKLGDQLEITLEANPDDLTRERLEALALTPINRLSIGIQSFDDRILQWMNRAHNRTQALQCLDDAIALGFDNISVDFIYGVPNQSILDLEKHLHEITSRGITHLSCYALTVEPKTALSLMITQGKTQAPKEENMIDHFYLITDYLSRHGYEHYEISNFAKDKKYSKHNTSYWQGIKYLGIGPSAHSFDGKTRQWNISNNAQYISKIMADEPIATSEELLPIDLINETIMTNLRTMWGLNKEKLIKADPTLDFMIQHYIQDGKLEEVGPNIRLTNDGKLIADTIIRDFFLA